MSFLEEIREVYPHLFSRVEFKVLEYLNRCPWGATVHEIASEVRSSFKSLYSVLRLLEKSGWIIVIKEKNGSIGRPRNKYVLKNGITSILKELEDCGCEVRDGRIRFLNLTKIAYPYSLKIFKRAIMKLNYGECLIVVLTGDIKYPEFIESAYKKDLKLMDISINNNIINMVFKKI